MLCVSVCGCMCNPVGIHDAVCACVSGCMHLHVHGQVLDDSQAPFLRQNQSLLNVRMQFGSAVLSRQPFTWTSSITTSEHGARMRSCLCQHRLMMSQCQLRLTATPCLMCVVVPMAIGGKTNEHVDSLRAVVLLAHPQSLVKALGQVVC